MLLLLLGIVLAALLASATDARAAGPTVYGGGVGPGAIPFALEIPRRTVLGSMGRVIFSVDVPCPHDQFVTTSVNERIYDASNLGPDATLLGGWDSARRFSAEGSRGVDYDGGWSGTITERIQGRVRGAAVRGTYAVSVDLRDAQGNDVGPCQTGPLRWSARSSPGRIYAGATSDDRAVVIRLDRARRRVVRADISSFLFCADGGGSFGHNVFDGPVRAGRFSAGGRC